MIIWYFAFRPFSCLIFMYYHSAIYAVHMKVRKGFRRKLIAC